MFGRNIALLSNVSGRAGDALIIHQPPCQWQGNKSSQMNRPVLSSMLCLMLSMPSLAADRITKEDIRQVMDATDTAALNLDAAGIGMHLSESFNKVIEFPVENLMAKVRLNKDKYLELIRDGWIDINDYDYRRDDVRIHIMPDGHSGASYSTVTEHMVVDGEEMISRFREYATYEIENGRPVITRVTGHTLLGDTTPN